MRHRHRPPFGRHGRPPFGPRGRFAWMAAKGLHRRVLRLLTVGLVVGALGGAWLHAQVLAGAGAGTFVCVGLSVLFAVGPLAWVMTFRLAKPLRELALVAAELHRGELARRGDLPEAGGEVGEVASALRALADRLAKQLHDQRALLAAVSHELRSPLGRMRVLVEMGREGSAPATLFDDLDAEVVGMDRLVGDLLAAARIDFEAVSPRPLVVADLLARVAEVAGLAPDAIDGCDGEVGADATLLTRALAGLVDNARRYGGRTVTLRAVDRGDRVRFEVDDDGPGFAPGDEERAFEPFWRGHGDHGPRGEGLGLALVRQIAEAHGGEAGAANREGGGARVWVEVPRAWSTPAWSTPA